MKSLLKKTSLLFVFLVPAIVVNAQDETVDENIENTAVIPATETKTFEHQIGFNATQLIQAAIGNGSLNAQNPYQVNYKFLINTKPESFVNSFGLRAGYGQFKFETKVVENTNNFINTSNLSQSNLRLGIEVQKRINDKWLVFFGVDYTILKGTQESKFENNNPPNTFANINYQDMKSNGIGPVLGVQFNVNKNIVLNTELSFYMTNAKSTNTQETIFNGVSTKQSSEIEMKTSNIVIPAFINFNIRF